MGQLNSISITGKIKSPANLIPGSTEHYFTLRNRRDTLGSDGKGKRLYSRIPVIIPDLPSHATVAANLVMDAEVKVLGSLVRRKMSRPDGTTYMTTAILGEWFEISVRTRPTRNEASDTDEDGSDDA